MDCKNSLFHVDTLVVDGVPINITDSSAMVSGLAGFENEPVTAAGNGEDAIKRKKVPRIIKAKLMLTDPSQTKYFSGLCNSTITLRDTHSSKRIMFNKCSFGKMGDVGGGEVDIEFIGISQPVYL